MNGIESAPRKRGRTKLDDKAAKLENELARFEKKVENGKFVASFAATVAFLAFISVHTPWYAFVPIMILSIAMLIALAYHWNFPEIVRPLNDLFYSLMRKNEAEKSEEKSTSPDEK